MGRLHWPFSLDTFYGTEAYRTGVSGRSQAKSDASLSHRLKLHWPFSLEAFNGTEIYRTNHHYTEGRGESALLKVLKTDYDIDVDAKELQSDENPLAESLRDCFVESQYDDFPRRFAPAGTLNRVMTPGKILKALEIDLTNVANATLIAYIYNNCLKTFATAVYSRCRGKELLDLMQTFMVHGLDDKSLPLKKAHQEGLFTSGSIEDHFFDAQWIFLAPVFSKEHLPLDKECILPFTKRERAQQGAFSRIFKAEIHPYHLSDWPSHLPPPTVALKTLPTASGEESQHFEQELKSLKRLGEFRNLHILSLISSFTRGQESTLILEWADGGDLGIIWRNTSHPFLNRVLVMETLKQFRGIAEALHVSHEAGFRHGDIKPTNILSMRDEPSVLGTLKLGDWGLAKKHDDTTRNRDHPTETRFGTRLYEPPEALDNRGPRPRLYDIWGFGCVLLEQLIWLLYGDTERERFLAGLENSVDGSMNWSFYEVSDDKPQLHTQVEIWLNHMMNEPRCKKGTCLGDMLDLVKKRILVVDLPRPRPADVATRSGPQEYEIPVTFGPEVPEVVVDFGEQQSKQDQSTPGRASAGEIVKELEEIFHKANTNPEYYIHDPNAWKLRGPRKAHLGRSKQDAQPRGVLVGDYTNPPAITLSHSEQPPAEAPKAGENPIAAIEESSTRSQEARSAEQELDTCTPDPAVPTEESAAQDPTEPASAIESEASERRALERFRLARPWESAQRAIDRTASRSHRRTSSLGRAMSSMSSLSFER